MPVAYLAWCCWNENLRATLLAGCAAAALALVFVKLALAPHAVVHVAAPAIDMHLAEATWSIFTQNTSTHTLAAWSARVPTWAAPGSPARRSRDRIERSCNQGAQLDTVSAPRGHVEVRRASAIVLAIVCTVLPIALQCAADRHAGWLMVDFRAYYCASLAQRENANPYFAAPLHACESRTPPPYYRAPATVTVPAPYPPYALAFTRAVDTLAVRSCGHRLVAHSRKHGRASLRTR